MASESCLICYEALLSDPFVVEGCRHAFCQSCIIEHGHHAVTTYRRVPIPCPSFRDRDDPCDSVLSDEQAKEILKDRYQQYLSLRTPEKKRGNPRLLTPSYQTTPETRLSEQTLKLWTKPCSHCGSRILKSSGCDHILCPACGNDMCYKCGTHRHLSGKVIRSCARCKQGYVDHRYEWEYRLRVVLLLPFTVPFMLVYVAVMFALSVASCFFGFCFGCGGRWLESTRQSQFLQLYAHIVFLPFYILAFEFGIRTAFAESMLTGGNRNVDIPIMELATTVEEEEDSV